MSANLVWVDTGASATDKTGKVTRFKAPRNPDNTDACWFLQLKMAPESSALYKKIEGDFEQGSRNFLLFLEHLHPSAPYVRYYVELYWQTRDPVILQTVCLFVYAYFAPFRAWVQRRANQAVCFLARPYLRFRVLQLWQVAPHEKIAPDFLRHWVAETMAPLAHATYPVLIARTHISLAEFFVQETMSGYGLSEKLGLLDPSTHQEWASFTTPASQTAQALVQKMSTGGGGPLLEKINAERLSLIIPLKSPEDEPDTPEVDDDIEAEADDLPFEFPDHLEDEDHQEILQKLMGEVHASQ